MIFAVCLWALLGVAHSNRPPPPPPNSFPYPPPAYETTAGAPHNKQHDDYLKPPPPPGYFSPYDRSEYSVSRRDGGLLARVRSGVQAIGSIVSGEPYQQQQQQQQMYPSYGQPTAPVYGDRSPRSTPQTTGVPSQDTGGWGVLNRLRTLLSERSALQQQQVMQDYRSPQPYTPPRYDRQSEVSQPQQRQQQGYSPQDFPPQNYPTQSYRPPQQQNVVEDERHHIHQEERETMSTAPSASHIATSTSSPPSEAFIPPEPAVMVVGDCIVLVLRPREFFRKKMAFASGGTRNLNVFTDFEHVLTKFHSDPSTGARAMGSADLLEASGALPREVVDQLRAVAEEYEGPDVEMDEAAFQEFTTRCHDLITSSGQLHMSSIPRITRELLPRLGMREGWQSVLGRLTAGGVPTYVFSSGYGDIVTHALSSADSARPLPQNLRVISNFFRVTPDGTVRGFSSPKVHERNKNASTASSHMDMPLPQRPHALILGSHEDDIGMSEGSGARETLSVGFLELTQEFPMRLPSFLNTFDAVVLGDGSFQFCKRLIEDIVQAKTDGQSQRKQPLKVPLSERQKSSAPYDFGGFF
eukprot:CAMPEP_0185022970 /NCGR_PEP_ID=MMETSP1103-20130426/5672_1 /TAXON_ID=36769 /ORGANISM="Paraphysomonas bandaiensis, Strain Caron Lab Isolate" /LENGTH=580 /DNA_ID=CAMNT_0027555311 /DNA_START=52 /DNA_END=1794 /DNA_ORIENTATION=-